jgi:hypothetical protein
MPRRTSVVLSPSSGRLELPLIKAPLLPVAVVLVVRWTPLVGGGHLASLPSAIPTRCAEDTPGCNPLGAARQISLTWWAVTARARLLEALDRSGGIVATCTIPRGSLIAATAIVPKSL